MQIANHVEMLEIDGEYGVLYPVLIWDDDHLVLIDTVMPGQEGTLREAVLKAGFPLEKITTVIITHQDIDHIGCAKALAELGAEIFAYETEAPYIQGDKTSIRVTDAESRINDLTEAEREFFERTKKDARRLYVHVDLPLKDNETLDICGGIKVIHTPGHTPGHISLLLKRDNILVAGDAANITDGAITGASPEYTRDMREAQASLDKMMGSGPASVVCYHGGFLSLSGEPAS